MQVRQYEKKDKNVWDEFIRQSKNGTFLFYRDYMDYHSDRFTDCSLIIYDDKNRIAAILPANRKDNFLISHGGLTYGSFITTDKITTPVLLDVFNAVITHLKKDGFIKLVYKTIPYIYHKSPADEDRYPLFLYKANLYRRDVLSVVFNSSSVPYQERRLRSIKKAQSQNLVIKECDDYNQYWKILEWNLKTIYNLNPVHKVEEIKMLSKKFPKNIRLFCSYDKDKMLGGLVIYESDTVAHNQYSANGEEGKKIGAVDIIFDHLLNTVYKDKPFFDFGISNEQEGNYLNRGLIEYKESFGARAVTHDFYELNF